MRSSEKPLAQISRELDVSEQTLRNWRKQEEIDEREREGLTTDEHEELRRLKKRVRVLKQEKEVLRKATAFFAPLPRLHPRRLQPTRRRLGDGEPSSGRIGGGRFEHGAHAPGSRFWTHTPLGPREAIYGPLLRPEAQRGGDLPLDGQGGIGSGQRDSRSLRGQPEGRDGASEGEPHIRPQRGGKDGRLRLHRGLLQHEPHPLLDRVRKPGRLRASHQQGGQSGLK